MKQERIALFLILSMHLAGIVGLMTPWRGFFQDFTPVHILVMTALLLRFGAAERRYWMAAALVAVFTFLVEMTGVQTGLLFGDYTYGATLGPKVMGTPLVIGANWVLLSFSIAHLLGGADLSLPVKAMLGATLMVGVDVFIEPVAMSFDFWSWQEGVVPMRNYLGWWVVSLMVFLGLFRWIRFEANAMAGWLLFAQLAFFLTLHLVALGV